VPTLDPDQAAAIADSITALAAAVNDYLDNHDVPDPEYSKLNSLQSALTTIGADLEQKAAQIEFADTAAAFAQLTKATVAINATADQLKAEVANISKVAAIVGTVASLASALGGGVAGPIISAAQKVVGAAQ
jgi:PHP family Zn ribbon phosphoesterase